MKRKVPVSFIIKFLPLKRHFMQRKKQVSFGNNILFSSLLANLKTMKSKITIMFLIFLFFLMFLLFVFTEIKSNYYSNSIAWGQSVPNLNQGIWIEYVESNTFYDPQEPAKVYYAESLFDNLYETGWLTQSKVSQPTIKINFHIPMTFTTIYIKNGIGDEKSQDYIDNGRVKTLQIRTKYKNYNLNLLDTSQWQQFTLEKFNADYIELVILDYYPGKKWFTIGMSEISFNFPSSFILKDITEKGQNLYSWMLQNIPMVVPKDKIQYTRSIIEFVKSITTYIGLPRLDISTVREQAFPYFAFISNRKFLPFSAGFPRNEEILNLYKQAFGSVEFMRLQVDEAFSPSYFFSLYANALQPYAAMLAKSMLLNTLNILPYVGSQNINQNESGQNSVDQNLNQVLKGQIITLKDNNLFQDKLYQELLLHFLILGMDLRSTYYKIKYGKTAVNGLPISARVQFTFYRMLRSLKYIPYKPIKFYLTVMLEDAIELQNYIEMLVIYIKNKVDFEKEYLETGEIQHITYSNDEFYVASIGNVDEFGQFAISMYLHNEDLIRYFKKIVFDLPYDKYILEQLSKILIEANYYAKHPERQYY